MHPLRTSLVVLAFLTAAFVHPSDHSQQTPAPAPDATPSAPAAPPAPPGVPLFAALYERGSAWEHGKGVFEQKGIDAHMQYLRAHAAKLLGAGRFGHATDAAATDHTVGLVIITAASQEEAEAFFSADPAVTGRVLKVTVRRWEARRVKAY